ncbi:MerR family transcriptional regulator [Streptomyces sp. NPDC047072]|uniref:MerR family transcriptional regulator n=1 Tax=Streptomyces sp. NPDC047072 TaxID=3154809 RepID=UPI0033EEC20C
MRTVDVAEETGYSVQQVRDLERLGVIPPAARSDNGYRSYTTVHVHALRAYRGLAGALGPVEARRLLTALRAGTLTEAAAAVDEAHARLARERAEVLRAQGALRAIQDEETGPDGDSMTITELAEALGVRSSTLRFWEQEGLVEPERVTTLRARRYGPAAVGAARIVTALRAGGYGVPAVREIMGTLDGRDGLEETRRLLGDRLDRIAARSVALLRAGADLAEVVTAVRESAVQETAVPEVATPGAPPPPA